MKKVSLAAVIIGAFVIFSLLHSQSGSIALTPKSASGSTALADTQPQATTAAGPAPGSATVTPSPSPAQTPTPAPAATTAGSQPAPTSTATGSSGLKDGAYTGSVADAQWGYVQVKAIISGGKITDVQFLQYPNDRSRSVYINSVADPQLTSEAIQAQSAQVDVITGATDSSQAFIQSLSDALTQAQA